jgi:hypothetical protein
MMLAAGTWLVPTLAAPHAMLDAVKNGAQLPPAVHTAGVTDDDSTGRVSIRAMTPARLELPASSQPLVPHLACDGRSRIRLRPRCGSSTERKPPGRWSP